MKALSKEKAKDAIELLQSLIRINTTNPPGSEFVIAKWLRDWLKKHDIESQIIEVETGRANLIVTFKGKKSDKALLYTGHMDTVPPGKQVWEYDPFEAEIVGDRLYGRGAADMKSGLAAMLYSLVLLKEEGIVPAHDVILLATAGEEVNCLGAKAFVASGGMKKVGASVVGEPSNGEVIIAHKGSAWLEIITHGATAHGSMPHLGINAIVRMNKILSRLAAYSFTIAPNKWLGMPTLSINRIDGGVATNVVPDTCTCQVDFRLIPGQTLQDALKIVGDIIDELKKQEPGFSAESKVLSACDPVECPEKHALIQIAQECADQNANKEVNVRGVNFYTDASILLQGRKLPVIFYGPGDDAQAHQPNEYVELEKYLAAIGFYTDFAQKCKIQ